MSKNCPFSTHIPPNIKIPHVPVDTHVDVPYVPRPYSGVSNQMGGTTPSKDSINNSLNQSFYSNKIYQINAPHSQNTLTPCSVIETKPSDPNSGPRKCYNIYSSGQNMVGVVCTTPGTNGPLFSREGKDGVNGNADWFRGNHFGVNYDDSMINDRIKYYYKTPSLKENKKTYVNYDQFYPVSDRCSRNKQVFKEYPQNSNFTRNGYPTWRYPYATTQADSKSPTQLVSKKESVSDILDLVENFSSGSNGLCNHNVFWVGSLAILSSLFLCNNFYKRK